MHRKGISAVKGVGIYWLVCHKHVSHFFYLPDGEPGDKKKKGEKMDQEKIRERFKGIFRMHIQRPGAAGLLEWMESNGFFEAPASKRHHGAYPGGLAAHSINVFERLGEIAYKEIRPPEILRTETIAVAGLLHDLCKINEYKKADDGYQLTHNFPAGHGEKSVILIMRHMQLTDEEILAIRWHMGQYDFYARGGGYDLDNAFRQCKLAVMLHLADMMATHFNETEGEKRGLL